MIYTGARATPAADGPFTVTFVNNSDSRIRAWVTKLTEDHPSYEDHVTWLDEEWAATFPPYLADKTNTYVEAGQTAELTPAFSDQPATYSFEIVDVEGPKVYSAGFVEVEDS